MASKNKERKKSKKINLKIAPYNWVRIQQHLDATNESDERTGPKRKITDVVNEALKAYFD